MKNIVLIGMPGAGTSTIGVLLAKSMLMDFVDTDLLIQKRYASSLCDIIKSKGIDEFLSIENSVISSFEFYNCVIATGGSAVYGTEAMEKLNQTASIRNIPRVNRVEEYDAIEDIRQQCLYYLWTIFFGKSRANEIADKSEEFPIIFLQIPL